jgi:type VI secretion system protein ImpA
MSLAEGFLDPISPEKPAGEYLRYTPLYDQIQDARRPEDTAAMGEWQRADQKSTDPRAVEKLASEALKKKTKDLQLAVWLTDAWIHSHGFEGLQGGLDLLRGLIEQYWDTVYPEIEDGDLEMRAGPLEWLGTYFDPSKGSSPCYSVQLVPLNDAGHSYLDYKLSRQVPSKAEADKGGEPAKKREALLKEGKLAPEDFDAAFEATPKRFYKLAAAQLTAIREQLKALDDLCAEKFGRDAPSFHTLAQTVEEIDNLCQMLLKRKLEVDPDPVEMPETEAEGEATPEGESVEPEETAESGAAPDLSGITGLQPKSLSEAVQRIVAAAHYLRKQNPREPAAYLILRSLRWGEVRPTPEPSRLVAPTTEVRLKLKRLAAAQKWADLLEAAEQAMGSECGRGWLDLQRYAVQACTALGYDQVAETIKAELKHFLAGCPQIATMTMLDDTGTANPETAAWLSGL